MSTAVAELWQAADRGDTERVGALLKQNPSLLNVPDSTGKTVLCHAAGRGLDAAVSALLKGGARQDGPKEQVPPVVNAVLGGHDSTLGLLLDAGGDANAADERGTTALHAAAGGGHKACVQRLLAAGAAVNVRNQEGITPLMRAVCRGHAACVRQLLAAGADVSAADNEGDTPLLWAANHDRKGDIVALVLGAGASVAETSHTGWTALHYAANAGFMAALRVLADAPGVLPVLQARCCRGARRCRGVLAMGAACSQPVCCAVLPQLAPAPLPRHMGWPSLLGVRMPRLAPTKRPWTCPPAPPPSQQA